MIWSVITAIAAKQAGLIARWQIIEAGGTDEAIRWALRQGRLIWVRRGVYAVTGSPEGDRALMAACLACGRTGAASHMAAAHAWGAEQIVDGLVQVSTFDRVHRRLPGVTIHRSRLDHDAATTKLDHLPVVVPGLAVVQCAKTCDAYLVARIANDLVKKNVTTFADILNWIAWAHDGPRPKLLRLCTNAMAVGGHYDSPACRELCQWLTKAGAIGYKLDYQVVDGEGVLLVDIAWVFCKVGIEYNGRRDHDNPLDRARDTRRRNRLAAAGWTM